MTFSDFRMRLSCVAVLVAAMLVVAPGARGGALKAPSAEVLLTVTGDIAVTNDGDAAVFDLPMLRAIATRSFTTTTIWTDGEQRFKGVPLEALLDRLGVTAGRLKARALNDYAVDIPVSDAVAEGPIIAYRRNGKNMSIRDKGPLWIVYPYDSKPAYRSEQVYTRSIWQLDRIKVIE
jgi:hypothetical protein